MEYLFTFILRMFLDQRGEVGDDVEEMTDDDVIEIDPDDSDDDEPEEDEEEPDKEPETDFKAEIAKKDDLLKKQDETIKEHNRNLYGLRKKFKALEKSTAEDKDVKFTDEQLEGMVEEHQDDPKTLVQIFKQISKQAAGDEAKAYVNAKELSNRKKDLDGYLTTNYPEAFNEGSQDHQDLQKAKEYLGLEDHPLGDYLAGSATMALQMPGMIEKARDEAKESAIKVEDTRKKSIKETNLESGKKKGKDVKPSGNALAVAKQLDLSKPATKVYLQLLNKPKTASVEV